ncbi:unnamed protein product, partial [Choristocarpus tenellus]
QRQPVFGRWIPGLAIAALSVLELTLAYVSDPYTIADRDRPKRFWDTKFELVPCCEVTGEIIELTMFFKTDVNFTANDALVFSLPRLSTGSPDNGYTDGTDIAM